MKQKPLQVLLVEDNAGDARLLREMFRMEGPGSFELTHLLRMSDALTHLDKGGVDIVLLDMGLPDAHGLETVRRVHAVAPAVPLIVITGLDDEALVAQAMKEGAQDYLIKGQIENRALPRALRHAVDRHRMQTETDLIRTNQMQFKDEFLSHVSHELRSPLTAIYQFVTILLDKLAGDLTPEQQEYLGIVLRNVKQLQSMINDLLEVTRAQSAKLFIEPQCTSASDAVVYAVNTLQGAAALKDILLSADVPADLPSLWADPTRVRQILIILLDNAIKFTPDNGRVRIRVRLSDQDHNLLLLEVTDSGCGIPQEMTERIFERMVQASDPDQAGRQGLGLGLYICKDLVTRQGGKIWAHSVPGLGSVFSVTLPVFSLASLMAPVVRKKAPEAFQITLVVVEMRSRTGWLPEKLRAEHSHCVREVLQRCLQSDLDTLLPKIGPAAAAELFFIVAMTDSVGAAAITKRICEKLSGTEQLQQAGLTFLTSHRALPPAQQPASQSMDSFLENVASEIQRAMNEETSMRMVEHG